MASRLVLSGMQSSLGASRHTVHAGKPRAAALRQSGRKSGLAVLAIAAPVREEALSAQQQQQKEQSGDSLTSAAVAAAASRGRVVLESPEELKSTWEHRAWTAGACALLAATLAQGVAQVDSLGSAAGAGAAVLAAYYMADVGTAFYHWGVDNYGDADTAVFGEQIAAFQGHHQRPWTITEREFCNNMHKLFRPASFFAAGLAGMAAAGAPMWWDVWSSSFLFLCCMSQQFHAWSHMKKSELPTAIVALQDAGLLISRRDHGAHHKSPFNCKYSIVSGWCNPLLDGDCPENSVWMKLEKWIHEKYGVEPRGWYEPSEQWKEQERTGVAV